MADSPATRFEDGVEQLILIDDLLAQCLQIAELGEQFQCSRRCRLWIRRADGQAIEPSRLAAIEVQASENPGSPMTNWTRLPASLIGESGMARIDDDAARDLSSRFYRIAERP